MKLTIVMPIYNEGDTIKRIVDTVNGVDYPVDYELIIVDDFSTDKSYAKAAVLKRKTKLEGKNIRVFKNKINHGKGFSIRRGIKVATGDYVVIQDGDTEYDPNDIAKLMEPILKGEAQVVYGSRFLKNPHPSGMALPNLLANKALTTLTNILFGSKLTDVYTCYKLAPVSLLKECRLRCNRFEIESEMATSVLKRGIPIKEVPIAYEGRTVEKGKKIKARDFFFGVWELFYQRFTKIREKKNKRFSFF